MGTSSPKHITNLLSPGPGLLGTIINQIQFLKQLCQAVRSHLPSPLDQHCRVAAVRQTTVVVHADSPAWATRLRYLAPALAASLRDQPGYSWVRDIKIKVRPAVEPPPASTGRQTAGTVEPRQALQHVPAKRTPTS